MPARPITRIWIAAAAAVALGIAAAFVLSPRRPHPPVPVAHPAPPALPGPAFVPDAVDGEPVPPAVASRRAIAVMIDNLQQARPQWGLSAASRVYEALTEGGITRYLAVFAEHDAGRIGPVRSARTQFLDAALVLDAALAHVGGNEDALALIPRLGIKDLDEFRYGGSYRRIFAPGVAFEHTVFTSTQALRALIDRQDWSETASIAHPIWKDDPPARGRTVDQWVTIPFSTSAYAVTWIYRPATNDYERMLGGAPDRDAANGQALTATSIAIAAVKRIHGRTRIGEDTWTFLDVGSGPAWVVQDGTVTRGTWVKTSRTDRLRFLDTGGREITFERGPQWVEIIPPEVTPAFSP